MSSSSFAATAHANDNDPPEKSAHDNDEEDCAKLKASNLGVSPALEPKGAYVKRGGAGNSNGHLSSQGGQR